MMHTYRKATNGTYEVGYHEPRIEDGTVYYYWNKIAEFHDAWDAAKFVNMLNGGEVASNLNTVLNLMRNLNNEQSTCSGPVGPA